MPDWIKVIFRWLAHRWQRLIIEFNLNVLTIRPRSLSYTLIHYGQVFIACTFLYAAIRFSFIALMTQENGWAKSLVEKLYNDNWFELIFTVAVVTLGVVSIIRLIWPIRFSLRISIAAIAIYLLYYVEKTHFGYFRFFQFKNVVHEDYFKVFIIVPIFELLFRGLYVFTSRHQVNNSVFVENEPISNERDDKTTRKFVISRLANELKKSHFESAYSIGIVGDWGVGKTSFIRVLENKLKKFSIIIHFNPWLSLSKSSLIQEFIDSLKDNLSPYDASLNFSLNRYLESLTELEKSAGSNFANATGHLFAETKSSQSQFALVRQSLLRINRRIVIFIDDLDRLDKNEIIEVLKLIRNTGNFPQVIYITCYDKLYLLHALQSFSNRNLNMMLDKFFDIEIPLAPIPSKDLVDLIDSNFLSKHEEISQKDADLIKERLRILKPFGQFREVKKTVSSLLLNYQLYGKRLYIHDFFLFEILRVRYPFIPPLLWTRQAEFFVESGSPIIKTMVIRGTNSDQEHDILAIEKYLVTAEQGEQTKHFLTSDDISLVIRILQELFPDKLGHPSAIQEVNVFEAYFYNYIQDSILLGFDLLDLIKTEKYEKHSYFETYDIKKESFIMASLFESDDD